MKQFGEATTTTTTMMLLFLFLSHLNGVFSQGGGASNDLCFNAQSLDSVLSNTILSNSENDNDDLMMAVINGNLNDATMDGARSPCGLFESGVGLWYTFTGDGNGIRMDTCLSSSVTTADNDAEVETVAFAKPTLIVLEGSCGSGALKGCAGVLSSTEEEGCTLVLSETTLGQEYSIFVERGFSLTSEFTFTVLRLPSKAIEEEEINSNGLCSAAQGPLFFFDNTDDTNNSSSSSVEIAVGLGSGDTNNKVSPWSNIETCSIDKGVTGSKGLWYYFNTPTATSTSSTTTTNDDGKILLEYTIFVCASSDSTTTTTTTTTTTALPSVFSSYGIIGGADGGEYFFCDTLNCITPNTSQNTTNFEGCRKSTQPHGITVQLEASSSEEDQKRYYVWVDNDEDIQTLSIVLSSSSSTPGETTNNTTTVTPPNNDECSNAETIEMSTAATGTLEGAQLESRSTTLTPLRDPVGVWYTTTAGINDTELSVSLASSSMANAHIIVYKGECGTHTNGAAMVAGFQSMTDTVSFNATDGERYTILVYSDTANGTFSVGVSSNVDDDVVPVTFCFAGSNRVKLLLQQQQQQQQPMMMMDHHYYYKTMKELEIGDYVQVFSSSSAEKKEQYSRIYSLGHIHHSVKTEYLQLFSEKLSKPLEITKDHLLFIVGKEDNTIQSIPASNVMVGDQLLLPTDGGKTTASSIVTEIRTLHRKGAYAPITEDGTIVVNGVVASCYPTLQSGSDVLQLSLPFSSFSIPTSLSMHTLSHLVLGSTRRLLCQLHWNTCLHETYTQEEGIATWAYYYMLPMAQWSLNYSGGLLLLALLATATITVLTFSTKKKMKYI